MSEFAIETQGLTRRFGRTVAVDGIDLRVPVGSVYGFLGRNGAGKTTTIQMLMGMLMPTAGTMRVLGFDPRREDVAMKRVVSYVPERVQMYDLDDRARDCALRRRCASALGRRGRRGAARALRPAA